MNLQEALSRWISNYRLRPRRRTLLTARVKSLAAWSLPMDLAGRSYYQEHGILWVEEQPGSRRFTSYLPVYYGMEEPLWENWESHSSAERDGNSDVVSDKDGDEAISVPFCRADLTEGYLENSERRLQTVLSRSRGYRKRERRWRSLSPASKELERLVYHESIIDDPRRIPYLTVHKPEE